MRPRLPRFHTLLDVLRADALDEVRETIIDVRPDFKVSEVELLPPVVAPEKILCIGVNYANRNEEYKDQSGTAEISFACSSARPAPSSATART